MARNPLVNRVTTFNNAPRYRTRRPLMDTFSAIIKKPDEANRKANPEQYAVDYLRYRKAYMVAFREFNKSKIRIQNNEWRAKNKEKIAAINSKTYHKHIHSRKARMSAYREKNKEHLNKLCREYASLPESKQRMRKYRKEHYLKNKTALIEYSRAHYHKNKDAIANRLKTRRLTNREAVLRAEKEYRNKPEIKVVRALRNRLTKALRVGKTQKTSKALELIGCGREFLFQYIQSKFKPGMHWNNHGVKGWHLDHIKPCSSFNLFDPEEQKKCFHYTNLQPLWWHENLTKNAKSQEDWMREKGISL